MNLTHVFIALACVMASAAVAQPVEVEDLPEDAEEAAEGEPATPPAGDGVLPDRPLMLRVGGSLTRDSNIFRAPDASAETIRIGYVGLSVDKAYAQQRLRLEVTETAYRYENFSYLDFDALNYLGAWDWRLSPRISGTLSAARAQSLADYSEFRNPGERNVRTTENFGLAADAWLFGGWHLTGGLTRESNRYSVPMPQEGSYRADGTEVGAKWVAPSGNWLALNLRSLDGRYLDRTLDPVALIDDGFRRRETEGLLSWRMTGKSTLDGRLAHVDYRSNHFAERDFSGIAARLGYLWAATAKLSVHLQFIRELQAWADVSASHRVEHRVTLGPIWQPTPRATLRLEASRGESDLRDPLPGFAGTPRSDTEHSVRFHAEWRALRNLSLNAGAQRYRQSSSDPAASFRGSQLTAGVSFLF